MSQLSHHTIHYIDYGDNGLLTRQQPKAVSDRALGSSADGEAEETWLIIVPFLAIYISAQSGPGGPAQRTLGVIKSRLSEAGSMLQLVLTFGN